MRGELIAHHGEGLHQARDVLMRANVAGVQQKRIVDLVTLQDAPLLLSRIAGALEESGVGRIVDPANAVRRHAQQILYIALGGFRNRDHTLGPHKAAAEAKAAELHTE